MKKCDACLSTRNNLYLLISNDIAHGEKILETPNLYRELQLLNKCGNIVHQNIIGSLILAAILATSAGISLLVQLNGSMDNELNTTIFLAMGTALANGLPSNMIFLKGLESVCANSKNVIKYAKCFKDKCFSRKDKLSVKKLFSSCNMLKVKFVNSNFLEELTPLRCFNFAVDMTVQFLIVSRNK